MPTLDQFLDAFRKEVGPLIQKTAGDRAAEARKAVEASLAEAREDLERWTTRLAAGELSLEDFEFLVQAGENPREVARRMGYERPDVLARTLRRWGRADLTGRLKAVR